MAALTASIAYHTALGVGLAALAWASGLGYTRLLRLPPVSAYAFGLAALIGASALVLVETWLGVTAAVLLLGAPLLALRGATLPDLRRLAYALPAIVAVSAVLGDLLHGPSPSLGSNAYGDYVVYIAKTVSATESLHPLRDLLALDGTITSGYAEGSSTFLGAALLKLHLADVFLFHASTLPAFLGTSLALGVGALEAPDRAATLRSAPLLGLLGVAMVAYPTWITESPMIALALPLVVPLLAVARDPLTPLAFGAISGLVAVDFVLTKVLGLVPLAVLGGLVALQRLRARLTTPQIALVAAGGLAGAALVIAFLYATAGWYAELVHWKNLPGRAWEGFTTQLHRRDTQAAAPGFEVVGQVLLLVALARARAWTLVAALAVSVFGAWFVNGYSFDVSVGVTVLVAVLHFWTRPDELARAWLPLAIAAGALAISSWFRDIYGVRVGFVLVVLLGAAIAACLAPTARAAALTLGGAAAATLIALGGKPYLGAAALIVLVALTALPRRVAAVGAAVVAAGAVAVAARGGIELGAGYSALTPADYDMWRHVERVVPRDGLVFTSQTGLPIDGRHGWNYYPGVAKRQVYLAGWYETPLQIHDADLHRRLRLNADVLGGKLPPRRVPGARRFSAYYAVLWRAETAPPGFRPVYRNRDFALYRIP